MGNFLNKLREFWAKTLPARKKIGKVLTVIGKVLRVTGRWIYRLRGLLISIPVALGALYLAKFNMENLPESVGINLLANGQYSQMIAREAAVMAPLVVTAACLVLVLCSRRIVYPWLIAVFSLVLPLLIYFTNVFPA